METPSEELLDIQKWMQSSLIDPKLENIDLVDHYVSPSKTLTAHQRLAIYQRSYYSRLIECMREQFKALRHTLGDDLFDDFSRLYLKAKPSSSPSLADLGKDFPNFLNKTRPDKDNPELWIDFMIAMAQFECDLYRIFDQEGSEGKTLADKNTLNENLKLQKCFSIHTYPFDVNTYYQQVAQKNNPEISRTNKIYIAFVRTNYQVYIINLTAIQYQFLESLQKGEAVLDILQRFSTESGLPINTINKEWLQWKNTWVEKGLFLKG
jgi:hypothetical protein